MTTRFFSITVLLCLIANVSFAQNHAVQTDRDRYRLNGPVSGYVETRLAKDGNGNWEPAFYHPGRTVAYTPQGFERFSIERAMIGNDSIVQHSRYTFDDEGRLSTKCTYNDDSTFYGTYLFLYDERGLLSQIKSGYGWDESSMRTSNTYEYDSYGHETLSTFFDFGELGGTFNSEYDPQGNLRQTTRVIYDNRPAFCSSDTTITTYMYDTLITASAQLYKRVTVTEYYCGRLSTKDISLYEIKDSTLVQTTYVDFAHNNMYRVRVSSYDQHGNRQYQYDTGFTSTSLPEDFLVDKFNCTRIHEHTYDSYNNWTEEIIKEREGDSVVTKEIATRDISYFN